GVAGSDGLTMIRPAVEARRQDGAPMQNWLRQRTADADHGAQRRHRQCLVHERKETLQWPITVTMPRESMGVFARRRSCHAGHEGGWAQTPDNGVRPRELSE